MRWLLRTVFALAVLVPLLLGAAAWLAVEDQPLVSGSTALDATHIERAKRLVARNDPRQMRPGMLRTLTLPQEDLELAVNYLAGRFLRGEARVVLLDGSAAVRMSLALPANPLGRYLNLDASLAEGPRLPSVDRLRIGRLPVPAFLCNLALDHALTRWEGSTQYGAAADAIKKISATPGILQVAFEWTDAAQQQALSVLVPPDEQARWRAYQDVLAAQLAKLPPGQSVKMHALLMPLLQLSQQRAAQGSADAEHRALLVVLAFYINGKGLEALVPAARGWPKAQQRVVTLAGRTDFAQHFSISAALSASAGGTLADAVGVYKEVDDSRGGSGFSFNDIAADRAGSRFGDIVRESAAGAQRLRQVVARGLQEEDLLPMVKDLPEFMPEAEFKRRFGGVGQPAYQRQIGEIERRIAALPLYR